MLTQIIKKIFITFLVFLLSFLQVISYTYDNFSVTYNLKISTNTHFVHLSKNDVKKVNNLKNLYLFPDGSKTTINIKGFNISKSKLDFITNYKGIFSYKIAKSKYNLKNSKKSNIPEQTFLLTSLTNSKNNKKEKFLFNDNFLENVENIIENSVKFVYKDFIPKNLKVSFLSRGPPYIISLTLI